MSVKLMNISHIYDWDNDCDLLKESARKYYANSRKVVKSSYEEYNRGVVSFFDFRHLGGLEKILYDTSVFLIENVDSVKDKEICESIILDLHTGNLDGELSLVKNVVNDTADQYFKEDMELKDHKDDCKFHCEYIIRKFRGYVKLLCLIIDENDFDRIFI